jgi:hypothetical protein
MSWRIRSRIAIVSAPALLAVGALAVASPAQASPAQGNSVGPGQFFTGEVFGNTGQSIINVVCPAAATTGHPEAGQTVEVLQLFPPVTATAGYTGDEAVEIDTSLIYPAGSSSSGTPIATFTEYSLKLPIPTSITVPCTGGGVMHFSPYPLDSGTASNVSVTFEPGPVPSA